MRRLLLPLLSLLLLLGIPTAAAAAPRVTMSARAANEGRVKQDQWVTVMVDLANEGSEVSGELIMTNDGGSANSASTEYVMQVALASGGKKRVPMQVPFRGNGQILVRFVSGGTKLTETEVPLTILPKDAILMGVLTEDELGLPALGRVKIGGLSGTPQVVRLDAATFPGNGALLDSFDVIAITRYDTKTLNDEQRLALETWVARGGTLLLAGGPEWKRTLQPLPAALLPVTVTGSADTDLSSLGVYADKPLSARGTASVGQLHRGTSLASSGGVPLVVADQVGRGRVVYLAVDPGLEPLVGWAGQPDLLQRALALNPKVQFGGGDFVQGGIMDALRNIPGLAVPAIGLVALIILLYLALVGPVNYAILKRLDRREWMWLTIPALSIVGVGLTYVLGFGRQSPLLSNVVTVTELTAGSKAARTTQYVGIFAPTRRSLSIPLPEARLVKPLENNFGPSGATTTRVITGEQHTLDLAHLSGFEMRAFTSEQDAQVTGELQISDLTIKNGQLQGRVVNRLSRPVSEVVVRTEGGTQSLGTLAPGASSEPFTVQIAGGATGPNRPGFIKGLRGPIAVPPDAFGQQVGTYTEEFVRHQPIIQAVLSQLQNDGTFPANVLISAWTDEPIVPTGLVELGRMANGANLVYAVVRVPIDTTTGELPAGIVTAQLIVGGERAHSMPGGWELPPGDYVFQLQVPSGVLDKAQEMTLHLGPPNTIPIGDVTVQVKNQKTGQWVGLLALSVQSLPDWRSLVSSKGDLEVKVIVPRYMPTILPTISTKGVAR